jgi:hypothetical protein
LSSVAIRPKNSPKHFGLAEIAVDQDNANIGDRIDGGQRLDDQFAHRPGCRLSRAAPFRHRRNQDRVIMSIEHADLPIAAVQFHRESPSRSEGAHDYVMIEPDNWLTKARQGIAPPCDPGRPERRNIDRMIKQAQKKSSRCLDEDRSRHLRLS